MILPGVEIHGLTDLITFPTTSGQDSQVIENVVESAPHVKGEPTVLDLTVRDAWKVPASKIRFTNPSWNAAVVSVVSEVRCGATNSRESLQLVGLRQERHVQTTQGQ